MLLAGASCSRSHKLTRVEEGDRDGVLFLGNFAEPRELDPELAIGIPEAEHPLRPRRGPRHRRPARSPPHPRRRRKLGGFARPDELHVSPARRRAVEQRRAADRARLRRQLPARTQPQDSARNSPFSSSPSRTPKPTTRASSPTSIRSASTPPTRTRCAWTSNTPRPTCCASCSSACSFPCTCPPSKKPARSTTAPTSNWTRPGNYVGNGPFVLTDWQTNNQIIAKKNPNYWNAAHIRINEVRYLSHRRRQHRGTTVPRRAAPQDQQRQRARLAFRGLPARTSRGSAHRPVPGRLCLHAQHDPSAARRRARAPRAGHEHRPREPRQKRHAPGSATRLWLHPAGHRRLHLPHADSI